MSNLILRSRIWQVISEQVTSYRATAVDDTTIAALQQRRITVLQHTGRTDGIFPDMPDREPPQPGYFAGYQV